MGAASPGSLSDGRREAVEAELERVLNSPPFRSSKRSAKLLSFVVARVLEGKAEELKERTLGVELFGRDLDYSTSEDATVRVAAGEVRKRLAQFYLEHGAGVVKIDLPAGSYVPVFQFIDKPVPPRRRLNRRLLWLAAGLALFLALGVFTLFHAGPARLAPDPLAAFWAPVLDSKGKILIAVGEVDAYNLSPPALAIYNSLRQSGCPDGSPRCRMPIDGLQRIPVGLVPTGDVNALVGILNLFHHRGRTWQVMGATETRFSDLRGQAAVLVGAGSNRWIDLMRNRVRYEFRHLPGAKYGIVDTRNPSAPVWVLDSPWPNVLNSPADYGMLARWWDDRAGSVVVCIAGIGPLGTQAAGELAVDPHALRKMLAGKSVDFTKRSVQIVFRTNIVDGAIGQSGVVAVHAE